jgi:hypothetical protein
MNKRQGEAERRAFAPAYSRRFSAGEIMSLQTFIKRAEAKQQRNSLGC